jgi:hypothetical protein
VMKRGFALRHRVAIDIVSGRSAANNCPSFMALNDKGVCNLAKDESTEIST